MIALDNKPLYIEGNTAKVWPDSANEPYTAPLTATIDNTDVTIGHKDVNIGGSASIEKIAGNTIKWNQINKVRIVDGTIINPLSNIQYYTVIGGYQDPCVIDHVYYAHYFLSGENITGSRNLYPYSIFRNNPTSITISIDEQKNKEEYKIVGNCINRGYFISTPSNFTATNFNLFINFIDLTRIFGEGNEPATVAEFETWLEENVGLEDYYPYDEGSLISTKATHIHTDIEDKEINITTLEGTKTDGTKEVMFPDGLKRAGDVYDEINYAEGKAIKRIGVVDLGALNWFNHATLDNVFQSDVTTIINYKFIQNGTKGNGVCKYIIVTSSIADVGVIDKSLAFSTGTGIRNIYVHDSSYTDVTTFKTAMSGVLLYYELAKPIEYKLDYVQPKKVVYREDPDNVTVKEIYKGTTLVWANYYGWDFNESTGTLTRIGNPEWHKTLPIQSQMRKAVVADDGTEKFISSINPDLYEDGTNADYSGKDGQVMTRLPKYNFSSYEYTDTNNVVHKVLKLYPYDNLGKVSPEVWFGSFEGIVDKETDRKLYSISLIKNMPAKVDGVYLAADFASADVYTSDVDDYRCGSADSHTASDGLVSTRRGRPATSLSITAFRGYAANRGTGWTQQYWTAYNSLCRLYTVEYCSFNSQAAYNDQLTADGYHQGGLGEGVTDANSNRWNAFNGYNPFIPCGITKELGNNTGVISFKFADGEFGNEQYGTAQYTTHVPCYRGIENPFGHIWKWTDGIHHVGDSTNSVGRIYATDDITKFANGTADEPLIDGYALRTEIPYTNGNIRDWLWDENGDFIPTQTTGTARISDYAYLAYNGYHALRSGRDARLGANAGLFCFHVSYSASHAHARVGSRLLYTPQS